MLEKFKKILIIRYRFVGDTVLSIPFIKNARENFPDAQIDVLVSPNSGELLEGNPDINNVLYLDTAKKHKYEKTNNTTNTSKTYKSFFFCATALRKEKYDLVFVLKRSFSSALLSFLSGAKTRIGFGTEFRSFLLTCPVKYKGNIHESENFLNCLTPLKIKARKYYPEIYPDEREKNKANGFVVRLDKFKPKVLIHASSAHSYKMWPLRYFAQVMDKLFTDHEAQFVFTGAKSDKHIYEKILSFSKKRSRFKILNLCGLTTIKECFAIYKGLDLAICVDSGNAHLAAAADIPTHVLFGPTRKEKWLPLGKKVFPISLEQPLPCQPCDVKIFCSHKNCMKLLKPQKVLEIVNC